MAPIVEQILSLFSVPQGNLFYALVLVVCTFTAWISCIYAKGKMESTAGRRMQLGMFFLFLVQLVLFAASWLTWLWLIDSHTYLPPLDRTLALFSLVLIIWLWAIPEPDRIWDALVTLVEIVIVLVGITGMVLWLREGATIFFNTSMLGGYAYYSGLGLLLIGLILLIVRRPGYWGYGLLMLLVLLTGYLIQYRIGQPPGDFAWFVHLGEMVAFLLLWVLPKRLVGIGLVQEARGKGTPGDLAPAAIDGKLIQSVSDVVTEPSPQKYYQELTRFVAQVMRAEFCLLMIPPKTGEQVLVPVGYNTSQNRAIEGFTADGRKMPSMLQALKNGSSLGLSGTTGSEVQALAEALGMKQMSHLLVVPFHPKGTSAIMGIAVLTKPAAPVWNKADAAHLQDVTDTLLANIGKGGGAGKSAEHGEMVEKLQQAEAYADQVRLEYAQLKAKYDSITVKETQAATHSEDERELLENVVRLESRNRDLESLLARGRPSLEEVEQLRLELRAALADLARIPSTLSRSDQKMLETQLSAVKSLDKMQPTELVTSIAQEFRQPLSSIVGYTDLLLGESVGLLGAVQRKFLERVKAATERLGILLSELVEVVTIDGGKVDQTPVSVEMEPVIHEAVGNIKAQLNEKNITIQMDLPEMLPSIQANRDALLQILANLLENACLVTPVDGTIQLAAGVEQRDDASNFILISVTDQGGGIENTDISRVFQRRYKMENPIIKGVGDTGVGLSIVKSLVDLLKGRVWVDSQPGGSTFSVLLPLTDGQINQPRESNS